MIGQKPTTGPTCTRCGAKLLTRRKYCTTCRAETKRLEKQEAKDAEAKRRLGSEAAEVSLPRIWNSKVIAFSLNASFGVGDNAGKLIDYLGALCASNPEYLDGTDARRHDVLLQHLKEFLYEDRPWNAPSKILPIKMLQIGGLRRAVEEWVFSFFDDPNPLMPSYALDTACFVGKLLDGFESYGDERWTVKSLIEPKPEREFFRFERSPQFKREFSQRMGTVHAIARIPLGASIREYIGRRELTAPILGEGVELLCSIKRCHLSSGIHDSISFECFDPNRPRYDICGDFEFSAHVLCNRDGFATPDNVFNEIKSAYGLWPPDFEHWGLSKDARYFDTRLFVPAHWITHFVDYEGQSWKGKGEMPKCVEVPRWDTEIHGGGRKS